MTAFGTARTPAIVGRADVLGAFESALRHLGQGSGDVLLVAGEPGIGKTSVLQAASALAEDHGVVVRWASCPQDDAAPPYWPLTQLLGSPEDPELQSVLTTLDDPGTAAEQQDTHDRFRLFGAVATAVRAAALRAPQMLVLDDLHWADGSTLRLLTFLVRQLATSPVLLTGGYRDTDLGDGHPLVDLLAEPGASGRTLTLEGLDAAEVADLAQRAGVEQPTSQDAERLRRHTGGNPFFVLNAARLVLAESRGAARDRPLRLPVGVRAVLERRLARLTQPCHELLRIAAVVGPEIDRALLARLADLPTEAADELLAEAVSARLIAPAAGRPGHVAFAHALVRSTAYEQLPAVQREAIHARVADLVRQEAAPGERLAELAHHELRSGARRAAAAGVDAAMAAGAHAVAARAYEEAAEHFQRAGAAAATADRRVVAHLAQGDAHRRAGDWVAANAAYLAAAQEASGMGRADLLAQAALGVGSDTSGFEVHQHDPDQLRLLTTALDALGSTEPLLRARLLARRAVATGEGAARVDRQEWVEEAVALAREAGEPRVLAYALSAWCDVHAGPAHVVERLATADEMLTVSLAAGDAEGGLLARRLRIVALLELGDPRVHDEIEAYAHAVRDLGLPLYSWYISLWRGMQAVLRGDLREGLARTDEVLRLGAEAGSDNAQVLGSTLMSTIMFEQGRVEQLVVLYAEAFAVHPHLRETPMALAMRAVTAVADRRIGDARAALAALAATEFRQIPEDSEWLSTLTGVVYAVNGVADTAGAAVLYRLLQPHAGRMVVDGIAAACLDPVDYLLGRLAGLLGQQETAAAHLRDAIALCRRVQAPLLAAHAQLELGRVLTAAGDPQGPALMAAAEQVLETAGAVPAPAPGFALEGDITTTTATAENRVGTFRRVGALWELTFAGRTARLPDAKGLHDLRHLLGHPGQPVPAVQLQRAGSTTTDASAFRGVEVLDDHAREAYRRRLNDLDAELDQARTDGDAGRVAAVTQERDFLVAELSAAVGLGGRARRLGDDADRARKAVTMRIRNAIGRINREHAELGRHLELTVRTGSVCSYDPEQPVIWTV